MRILLAILLCLVLVAVADAATISKTVTVHRDMQTGRYVAAPVAVCGPALAPPVCGPAVTACGPAGCAASKDAAKERRAFRPVRRTLDLLTPRR
jgi:hypothetical protein